MEVSGQLHAPAALPQGTNPWYPLVRRLGIPQSLSGHGGKKKSLHCTCQESNPGRQFESSWKDVKEMRNQLINHDQCTRSWLYFLIICFQELNKCGNIRLGNLTPVGNEPDSPPRNRRAKHSFDFIAIRYLWDSISQLSSTVSFSAKH
jgi:hypothetical protein